MKFTTAYYLMLLYVTVMIKPLIPFMVDEWDHQFNEIEHISIVHAKYGSHHLEKELSNSMGDNNKNKDQNTTKTEDLNASHVLPQLYKYASSINKRDIQYFHFTHAKLPCVCICSQGQPPEFS